MDPFDETEMMTRQRLQAIAAEQHATKLVNVLQAAVNGEAHWRRDAQQLLHKIGTGEME